MDHCQEPQHHVIRRQLKRRHTHGSITRYQEWYRKLPCLIQKTVQVSRLKFQHFSYQKLYSYAGLHCVVIKGYSKSAGYQPGVRFEDNRFRNSWNAVYVAGAWRFVQCNWGARHLVNAKEAPKAGNKTKSDSLR
jgi:hypothetical protein